MDCVGFVHIFRVSATMLSSGIILSSRVIFLLDNPPLLRNALTHLFENFRAFVFSLLFHVSDFLTAVAADAIMA